MALFSWVGAEDALSAAALTVRAQTIDPNDRGRLLWDAFFPRRDVDSVNLATISNIDFRPVADRREWNTRGRLIPLRTPGTSNLELVPIESYFKVNEREIQELEERTSGNVSQFRNLIGVSIPTRTESLAEANYRRIEIDAFTSWALGQVTARNPQTGATQTVGFGFSAARYMTAGTAWNNGAINAYDEFVAWLESMTQLVGPISGVMLRLATLKEIQKDAPMGADGIRLTRTQLVDRVQQDIGSAFQFFVNENTQDIFPDAGTDIVRTKVWPTGRIAVVPAGEQVGYTAFAPVARAYEIARQAPTAGIDVRGMTVYHDFANAGRELTIECQVNAMTIPNEQLIGVIDVGV